MAVLCAYLKNRAEAPRAAQVGSDRFQVPSWANAGFGEQNIKRKKTTGLRAPMRMAIKESAGTVAAKQKSLVSASVASDVVHPFPLVHQIVTHDFDRICDQECCQTGKDYD